MSSVDDDLNEFSILANILIRFKNNPEAMVSDYVPEIQEYYAKKQQQDS